MKIKRFLEGLIIILIGLILLANNFGILPWSIWYHLIRLWPIILIAIGLDLILKGISLPSLRVLPPLLIIGAICLTVYFYQNKEGKFYRFFPRKTQRIELSQPLLPNIKKATINLKFGVGELRVRGNSIKELMRGNFTVLPGINPWMRYREMNGEGFLEIGENKGKGIDLSFFHRDKLHQWDLKLNTTIPLSLRIDTGASNNDLDFSSLKIVEFDLDTGASNNKIRFGRSTSIKAKINGGASNIKIFIPHSMGVKIKVDTALTTNNLSDLGFEKMGNTYISKNFSTAKKQLDLDLDIGVSALKVKLY